MEIFVTIIQVLLSIALIAIVLFQSGKEAGLSGAIAGNAESYMNKNGNGNWDKKLATGTKWIAAIWLILTLTLSMF